MKERKGWEGILFSRIGKMELRALVEDLVAEDGIRPEAFDGCHHLGTQRHCRPRPVLLVVWSPNRGCYFGECYSVVLDCLISLLFSIYLSFSSPLLSFLISSSHYFALHTRHTWVGSATSRAVVRVVLSRGVNTLRRVVLVVLHALKEFFECICFSLIR